MKRRTGFLVAGFTLGLLVLCCFVAGVATVFYAWIKSAALGAIYYHGEARVPVDFYDDLPGVFLKALIVAFVGCVCGLSVIYLLIRFVDKPPSRRDAHPEESLGRRS